MKETFHHRAHAPKKFPAAPETEAWLEYGMPLRQLLAPLPTHPRIHQDRQKNGATKLTYVLPEHRSASTLRTDMSCGSRGSNSPSGRLSYRRGNGLDWVGRSKILSRRCDTKARKKEAIIMRTDRARRLPSLSAHLRSLR